MVNQNACPPLAAWFPLVTLVASLACKPVAKKKKKKKTTCVRKPSKCKSVPVTHSINGQRLDSNQSIVPVNEQSQDDPDLENRFFRACHYKISDFLHWSHLPRTDVSCLVIILIWFLNLIVKWKQPI